VTQGAESYKGKPIVYSLGNFVFDGFEGEARTGWLLRLRANKRGIVHWETLVARLDAQGLPVPDRDAMSPCGDVSGVRSCRGGVR
jgi:poly-gamma-glutamate synthesis protein (capsule biosynthesis protein)